MVLSSYLQDAVVLFGCTLSVIAVSRIIHLPPLIGFLITGAVIGPYGFGLIHNVARVEQFAELGVVFLLFEIGLEVSAKRLRRLGRYFFLGGPIQILCTILLTMLVSIRFGFPLIQSLFFGLVLSLSSTAIVVRIYSDRREIETPQGNIGLGILLFQDILIVPYLLLIPLMGGTDYVLWSTVIIKLGSSVAIIAASFVVSKFFIPRLLQYLAATRVREIFVMAALFLCFGAALLTQKLGFSLALGAFLVGVLIAESDYHHQVIADIMPFRDIFNSIFFISIGMLLKPDFVVHHFGLIALITLLIMAIKGSALYLTVRALGFGHRIATMVAMTLSQIGEFSFVVIQAGKAYGILDSTNYQIAIDASILTMALTPLLVHLSSYFGKQKISPNNYSNISPSSMLCDHVIVVGYGLAGQHLATVLKAATLPFVVLELNVKTVHRAKREGIPIIYGDASQAKNLDKCGIQNARVVVFVISDRLSVQRSVALARQMNPSVFIIARARMQADFDELRSVGADHVVSEEFETSIEIFTCVLTHLGIPNNIIRTQTQLLRTNAYEMLRAPTASPLSDSIVHVLRMGTIETFLVTPELKIVGMTLAQIDLRRVTGATVLALIRNDVPYTNPAPDMQINANDILVLFAGHAQMDAAIKLLGSAKTLESVVREE